ncbi:hypothetical protein M405DRAFT_784261 [Rhizopogon salebrosus TDB-379]|nr:hypothetical protein M405DRAFT_784261 [Rhizopogon salebrosus TDB-379]
MRFTRSPLVFTLNTIHATASKATMIHIIKNTDGWLSIYYHSKLSMTKCRPV